MPYIKQEKRPPLDEIAKLMILAKVGTDGNLKYILFRFCENHVEKRYGSLKNFIGELAETSAEIKRRYPDSRKSTRTFRGIKNNRIKRNKEDLDAVVQAMADAGVKANGDLNYLLSTFFKRYIPKTDTKNYLATLSKTIMEIRQKILGPYEDEKIQENGDV